MNKITPELLQKLAPGTPKVLRDRFLPFLNNALPRYGITTELRVAAFLATCVFESAYLRTMEEYGKGATRYYGKPDKVTGKIYYGRGIIQLTHKKNYEAFNEYLKKTQMSGIDVVLQPHYVATPMLAVESACWFWKENNLNAYADKGKFFAIQGIVNRGNPNKEALDYQDRLNLYEKALRFLPDDFRLDIEQAQTEVKASPPSVPSVALSTSASNPAQSPALAQTISGRDESIIAGSAGAASTTAESDGLEQTTAQKEPASSPELTFKTRIVALYGQVIAYAQSIISFRGNVALVKDAASPVSKSSWFVAFSTKAFGWFLLITSFLKDNWLYVAIAAVLIVAAIWYWNAAKNRATQRSLKG